MRQARTHRDIAAIVFFLHSSPRNRYELMELMGWNLKSRGTHQRLASILNSLRDEGLIEEGLEEGNGRGGRRKLVYRWIRPQNHLNQPTTTPQEHT